MFELTSYYTGRSAWTLEKTRARGKTPHFAVARPPLSLAGFRLIFFIFLLLAVFGVNASAQKSGFLSYRVRPITELFSVQNCIDG